MSGASASRIAAARDFARTIRADALRMVHRAKASHIGTCLSMADILACLYTSVLRIDPARPDDPERDRFILSKGHGAAIIYAALARRGFFSPDWLETYCADGTRLAGHITQHGVPGVDFSSGSLGHGLSVAAGLALGAKLDGSPRRVFCVLSDGECDEGSIWEAVLFAPHHRLDNLVAIVDFNKIQSFGRVKDVLDLHPFADKWRAFNWAVREIDGHDPSAILDACDALPLEAGRPTVLIAHTTKGRGVSFMQDDLLWHYRSPDADQLARALAEVERGGCA
jgi:transketolase